MEKIQHAEFIWTIPNFLTQGECKSLIEYSEAIGYKEAEVSLESGAKMIKGIRNNYRLILTDETLASIYFEKIKAFCLPEIEDASLSGMNEQFRFYKYENAQRFKRHIDGRFKRSENEESRLTFMIYLNQDFEGGETAFDHCRIKPETGTALLFIHELRHEGCPVLSGVKYALRSDIMYKKRK